MKSKVFFLLYFVITILVFSGCKKTESNPIKTLEFTAKGSDYLSVPSEKIVIFQATGSAVEYDIAGSVTDFTQLSDEQYSANIKNPVLMNNMWANPIYGTDENELKLLCYIFNNTGEILGCDNLNNNLIIVLPSQLTLGKEWIANPQSPSNEQYKIQLVDVYNSFTNSADNSYQNTINLLVTHNNEIIQDGYYYKLSINANLFIAKNVGIVGGNLNDYEEIERSDNDYYSYYKKIKASGFFGLID